MLTRSPALCTLPVSRHQLKYRYYTCWAPMACCRCLWRFAKASRARQQSRHVYGREWRPLPMDLPRAAAIDPPHRGRPGRTPISINTSQIFYVILGEIKFSCLLFYIFIRLQESPLVICFLPYKCSLGPNRAKGQLKSPEPYSISGPL